MSKSEKDNKVYVFLSHSHLDYDKVRVVRNFLEENEFRPLMLFLKCFEKEEYDDLTRYIIKKEIDSRQRFLLCRSRAALKSKWVQFEVEHIKSRNRPYHIVDLEASHSEVLKSLREFSRRSTVYLTYRMDQHELASQTNMLLKVNDFKTLFPPEMSSNGLFQEAIEMAIKEASKRGYVLVFLSGKTLSSVSIHHEVIYADREKARIIPVVITDEGYDELINDCILSQYQCIDVRNKSKDKAEEIVKRLIEIDMHLYLDSIDSDFISKFRPEEE